MRRSGQGFISICALCIVIVGILSSCGPFQTSVQVSGSVYGEDAAAKKAGEIKYAPLQAAVTCNGTSTQTDSNGSYSLSFDANDSLTCTISSSSKYVARTVMLKRGSLQSFHLGFAPDPGATCQTSTAVGSVSCPPLTLQPGTLRGTVTGVDDTKPQSGVTVQCWNTTNRPDAKTSAASLTTKTNADGLFIVHSVEVGPYGCVAGTDDQLQRTTVAPNTSTTVDLQMCQAQCPRFGYNNGSVMHSYSVHVIFWLPTGKHFEPEASADDRFMRIVKGYFQDIGGSDLYGIVTQYWDNKNGPMSNSVTLAGSYVDTRHYPHSGSTSDPLQNQDVQDEIAHAMGINKWSASPTSGFYVVTAYGINECSNYDSCTFSRNGKGFCAYHSYTYATSTPTIYAYVPVFDDCDYLPTYSTHPSPHGDRLADAVLSSISHEFFESASDPLIDAWYAANMVEGEMSDLCVDHFGVVRSDGSNVTLSNGHRYILQSEWSLADGACVLGLT